MDQGSPRTDLRVRFLVFVLASLAAFGVLEAVDPEAAEAPFRTLLGLGFGFLCALFWRQISTAWDVWNFFR